MARTATIIGHIEDVWGDPWAVREARPTDLGFDLQLGWPALAPRGKSGAGGPRVIITPALARHMEQIRQAPGAHRLPIGNTAVKRIRRLLGHHRHMDRAKWWEERADDLADLTIAEFAARHNVSTGAIVHARHALFGATLRPAYWWQAEDVAAIIRGDAPTAAVADALGLSAGAIRRLRAALRAPTSPKPR